MRNTRSILLRKTLLVALAILSFATASHADDRGGSYWWLSDPIEGLWNVTVNITPPPPSPGAACQPGPTLATFNSMALFARGGTFHDLNDTGTVGPGMPRTPGFGIWERLSWRHYRFAAKFFVFDAVGTPIGWTIVRHDVVVARDGATYVSKGTAENFDRNGVPVAPGPRPPVGCSNATAVRFE